MKKQETKHSFNTKRNYKLITPCCNKVNKNGKFITFKNSSKNYGYCHSCGKATLPPAIYLDESNKEFMWNDNTNRYEPITFDTTHKAPTTRQQQANNKPTTVIKQKYIEEKTIWSYYLNTPENNLMKYIRNTYNNSNVDEVFKDYALGTTTDGGAVFWNINKQNLVQKGKVAYYNQNGKRTNKFNAPYKNSDGYFSCLFGEHLIIDNKKGVDKLVLVESEKTAIIGAILLPEFVWLSYSGRNGLTEAKYNCLIGHTVLIIPDMSEKDVEIISNKIIELTRIGVKASIWDMTNGRTDEQLKTDGDYNCDLEDIFRTIIE
ncbi:DUF6371 domain-containing protein [uncultured Lacinutrix sp.]|uniref:DUF6371 domain-containing protein n=1 Tax=uncultured Lacinutrix sp. TaxID=574032 RepID=UPI0026159629|nr:DUF6371 domain-containing protein [uncultured Lacinutrix sp.]